MKLWLSMNLGDELMMCRTATEKAHLRRFVRVYTNWNCRPCRCGM